MTNNIVAYASHRVVQRFGDPNLATVDGLWFNKVMSLLNRWLAEKHGLQMELPHCWYFWGDRVVLEDMPRELRLHTPEVDGTRSRFSWSGSNPKDPPSRIRKAINSLVDSIRNLFPQDKEGRKQIMDAVYTYAPYEFQRRYATFRSDSYEMVDPALQEFRNTVLRQELRDALADFPFDDMPELLVEVTTLGLVGDALLEEGHIEATRLAVSMAKRFWEDAFCRILITMPKGHENVSPNVVETWKSEAILNLTRYHETLRADVEQAFRSYKLEKLRVDNVLKSFLIPEDWGPGSEDSSIIDASVYPP